MKNFVNNNYQMAELFQYINAMYCIRDQKLVPIHDPTLITTNDITSIHKKILSRAYDEGNLNALVFQNELFFTRQIGSVSNNEVKDFLLNNQTWDILILNSHTDLPLEDVAGFNYVHKVMKDSFIIDKVYIASRRFMEKVKNNVTTGIETYYYENTFVNALENDKTAEHKIKVGKITGVQVLKNDEIRYTWVSYYI